MKYQMSKEDRDWLLSLIDRSPLECSSAERMVCKGIIGRMVAIPDREPYEYLTEDERLKRIGL